MDQTLLGTEVLQQLGLILRLQLAVRDCSHRFACWRAGSESLGFTGKYKSTCKKLSKSAT